MEYFEDRWITRLDTKALNGMNTKLNGFAKTFYHYLFFYYYLLFF